MLPTELWKNLGVVELFWFQNGRQQLWSCLRTYLTGWSGGETGDKRVAERVLQKCLPPWTVPFFPLEVLYKNKKQLFEGQHYLWLRYELKDKRSIYFGKPSVSDLKIQQMTSCFKPDRFGKRKVWRKLLGLWLEGRGCSLRISVISWMFFYLLRSSCSRYHGERTGENWRGRGETVLVLTS